MTNQLMVENGKKYMMNNVNRLPVVFSKGTGSKLWDVDGKEYIDFLTGISVANFGHSHPEIVEAMCRQADKLLHVSNLYYLEEQVEVAEELIKLSGYQQVFFANSGAEANEGAIKIARKYGKEKLNGKFEIVTAVDSFHGRTLGALSATGQPKYQKNFLPVVPGFRYAEFNDLDSWKQAINDNTCAILLELVQGESGITPAKPDFINGLIEICNEQNILLMVDEIQTGLGRTGKMFAYEHFGFKPDLITIAKSLGGGIPAGAILVSEKANVFTPGDHSTTIGGGGMALAAAKVTLKLLQQPGLMNEVINKGNYFHEVFASWKSEIPMIKESRGLGMMLALDLKIPCKPVMQACLDAGLVINAVNETALRMLPAFNISQAEIDKGLEILKKVLKQF